MIITGRQFSYDRALQIVQDETYLEDSDFDEIKKIGQFDPNMNIPEIRQKWISKAHEYKHKGKTYYTHGKSRHSHRVKRYFFMHTCAEISYIIHMNYPSYDKIRIF